MMSSIRTMKEKQQAIILEHARAEDTRGLTQVLMTLALLALVWWAALLSVNVSLWLTAAAILLISLFSVRGFALMRECGHGSWFRTRRLTCTFCFLLGVVSGMPQYVCSQHHSYHHAHNGDWEKYRGPYTKCQQLMIFQRKTWLCLPKTASGPKPEAL